MAISTLTLRCWHRRFALVLGIFFIVQGLTGAISQQRFWLLQATAPGTYRVESGRPAAPPGDVVALIRQQKPDFKIAHMMYPAATSPNTAVIVMGGRDAAKHDMSRMILIDQYNNRIIGEQSSMAGWVGLASAVHKWLIFGVPGKIILTLLGTGVVVFSGLGMIIWWRTRHTSRNVRGVVRLHRRAGITAALFIISVAGTGTWLNLTTWAEKTSGRSVFASNMKMAGPHEVLHAGTMIDGPIVDGNAALAAARQAVGNLHLIAFGPPGPHAENYWFAFMDWQLRRVDVLIKPVDGSVIGVYPTGLTSGGDGAREWLFPVHSGYIIGPIGGVIYSVIGVSVSLWVLTGFVMWRRQRRSKRSS